MKLPFWALLTSMLVGCSGIESRDQQLLLDMPTVAQINKFHGTRMCTIPLANPDETPANAIRARFEELLANIGFMRRIEKKQSGGLETTTYVVESRHRRDVRVRRTAQGAAPEVIEICFGRIEATDILSIGQNARRFSVATVRYHASFAPWVESLGLRSRLPKTTFTGKVMFAQIYPHGIQYTDDASQMDYRNVLYPIDGRNWYPDGFPSNIRLRIHPVI